MLTHKHWTALRGLSFTSLTGTPVLYTLLLGYVGMFFIFIPTAAGVHKYVILGGIIAFAMESYYPLPLLLSDRETPRCASSLTDQGSIYNIKIGCCEISVKITQVCSRSIRVYGIFIWVWSFHLGMLFSFGYTLFFIRVPSSHLGI